MRATMVALGMVVLVGGTARAAVPSEFTVQGVLRDGSGKLQMMAVNVTVSLHDSKMGGARLWPAAAPTPVPNVPVSNGLFALALPDPNLRAMLASATEVWLEVTAGTDTFPRQKITTEVFALMSQSAEVADRLSASCVGCVADGMLATGISASKISGKVASATAADTAASASDLSCTGCVAKSEIAAGALNHNHTLSMLYGQGAVGTTNVAAGQLGEACAACPAGSMVVSGACMTNHVNQLMLVKSFQSSNSWCCDFFNQAASTFSFYTAANCLTNTAGTVTLP
jgi:hypothetical protein